MTKLMPDQEEAAKQLHDALLFHPAALDASDTGVGKTYTALGVARLLGQFPLVVCPKSIRSAWREVAYSLDVPLLDVCNIERLKTGNTPYLDKDGNKFRWNLKKDTLVIWDECQNASGYHTQNSKILAMLKAYDCKVLLLSATVADSPVKLRASGYLLNLHRFKNHFTWCLTHGCYRDRWGKPAFTRGRSRFKYLKEIHGNIFPAHGIRLRIADMDDFPENAVFPEAYNIDRSTDEINEIYQRLDDELKNPENEVNPLTQMLRARQQIELLKVPLLVDMTEDLLDEGKSIVIFISFRGTMNELESHLATDHKVSLIYGGQNENERDENIASFQSDEHRVMVAMIQAGGVGISLHDLKGDHPRVSLITPTFNAVQMKQALGRIHRRNGKSKCIQKIIFAADTVEAEACKAVRNKLKNIDLLNDGDLTQGILL